MTVLIEETPTTITNFSPDGLAWRGRLYKVTDIKGTRIHWLVDPESETFMKGELIRVQGWNTVDQEKHDNPMRREEVHRPCLIQWDAKRKGTVLNQQ